MLKSDVSVARNYLNKAEVSKLNRLVAMFIDYAELRALNRQVMTMSGWLAQVERFLNFTGQQILRNAGKISHEMAVVKALEEFENFASIRTGTTFQISIRPWIDTSKAIPGNEIAFCAQPGLPAHSHRVCMRVVPSHVSIRPAIIGIAMLPRHNVFNVE